MVVDDTGVVSDERCFVDGGFSSLVLCYFVVCFFSISVHISHCDLSISLYLL